MSIRSFVALSSLLLMLWLGMAFLHTPVVHGGNDPVGAEHEEISSAEQESFDFTVSVSPSEVAPD